MQALSSMHWYTQHSTEKKAMLGSAVMCLRQRRLKAAFAGMRECCSQKRHMRVMAVRALAYWKGSAILAAFSAWSEMTRERLRTREKVTKSPNKRNCWQHLGEASVRERKVNGKYARVAVVLAPVLQLSAKQLGGLRYVKSQLD